MEYEKGSDMYYLSLASEWARCYSGCTKVQVGAVIVKDNEVVSFGANRAIPDLCRTSRGCLRIELHGNDSKKYRGATDCRAIHSEIDAICRSSTDLRGSTIYITRYPCEGCARAIVSAGISTVVFGREQPISDMTKDILASGFVRYRNENNFKEEDTER